MKRERSSSPAGANLRVKLGTWHRVGCMMLLGDHFGLVLKKCTSLLWRNASSVPSTMP